MYDIDLSLVKAGALASGKQYSDCNLRSISLPRVKCMVSSGLAYEPLTAVAPLLC